MYIYCGKWLCRPFHVSIWSFMILRSFQFKSTCVVPRVNEVFCGCCVLWEFSWCGCMLDAYFMDQRVHVYYHWCLAFCKEGGGDLWRISWQRHMTWQVKPLCCWRESRDNLFGVTNIQTDVNRKRNFQEFGETSRSNFEKSSFNNFQQFNTVFNPKLCWGFQLVVSSRDVPLSIVVASLVGNSDCVHDGASPASLCCWFGKLNPSHVKDELCHLKLLSFGAISLRPEVLACIIDGMTISVNWWCRVVLHLRVDGGDDRYLPMVSVRSVCWFVNHLFMKGHLNFTNDIRFSHALKLSVTVMWRSLWLSPLLVKCYLVNALGQEVKFIFLLPHYSGVVSLKRSEMKLFLVPH